MSNAAFTAVAVRVRWINRIRREERKKFNVRYLLNKLRSCFIWIAQVKVSVLAEIGIKKQWFKIRNASGPGVRYLVFSESPGHWCVRGQTDDGYIPLLTKPPVEKRWKGARCDPSKTCRISIKSI
ncbi:uncharacterized protein LOC143197121 [Rhynchophorus ferrugineus]|uniref:uncharacterized protein LOC143197121 n=1 Tax=Rhynchophorus ferrugineus TaxID=354439 RepID=UPI003FCCD603